MTKGTDYNHWEHTYIHPDGREITCEGDYRTDTVDFSELNCSLEMVQAGFSIKPKTTKIAELEKELDALLDQVEQLAGGLASKGGNYPHPREQIKSLFAQQRSELLDLVDKEILGGDVGRVIVLEARIGDDRNQAEYFQGKYDLRAEQRQKLSALRLSIKKKV